MSKEIVIVGGLLDCPDQKSFLARLAAEVSADVAWEWLSCGSDNQYEPPASAVRRIIAGVVQRKAAARRPGSRQPPPDFHVIKLFDLHPRTAALLYKHWDDPIKVPADVRTADTLIAWLISPGANLFPRTQWNAGAVGAALMAILAKLIANASFNSSVSGHAWTKEVDLLTQSPVDRAGFSPIAKEARKMLSSLEGKLLLTKGSGQGKTPKEWSIDTTVLPMVKKCIMNKSFAPLGAIPAMAGILARIAVERDEYCLDGAIVSERVNARCRERPPSAPAAPRAE